jgi:hypothetical protein
MIRRVAVFVPVVLAVAFARAHDADAACNFGGCPDWPSDCHNLKSTKWCAKDGVSTVTITNHGSYESALDWARAEISDPHNGIDNSLTINQVASGGQLDVYNYTGSADWWGLADQYVTTNGTCLSSARIQINKNYMTTTVRKQYTMLHEIGHTVGLNHVCVCPRTMNPCGHLRRRRRQRHAVPEDLRRPGHRQEIPAQRLAAAARPRGRGSPLPGTPL